MSSNKLFFDTFSFEEYKDELSKINKTIINNKFNNLVLNYAGKNPIISLYLITYIPLLNYSLVLGDSNNFKNSLNTKLEINYLEDANNNFINNSFYLATSGTTGDSKLVNIDTDKFFNSIRNINNDSDKWLLTYNPNSYAGVQVILTAAMNNHYLYSVENNTPKYFYTCIKKYNINRISGTPTFWKLLVNFNKDLESIDLKNITLGGEIVYQELLDKLSSLFPNSKINHIYATTETGVVFSVSDKMEGFPCNYLKKYNLKIINDRLYILINEDEWFNSNDLCEIKDDRVLFKGRSSEIIKVAGRKVNIASVENVLNSLDIVEDSLVYAKKNPITGYILIAEIKLKEKNSSNIKILDKYIKKLNRYDRPATYKIVDKINLNNNMKKSRKTHD